MKPRAFKLLFAGSILLAAVVCGLLVLGFASLHEHEQRVRVSQAPEISPRSFEAIPSRLLQDAGFRRMDPVPVYWDGIYPLPGERLLPDVRDYLDEALLGAPPRRRP